MNEYGKRKTIHPGELLYAAIDSMRAGLPVKTVNLLSTYLLEAIMPVADISFYPLPAEHAVWLFELGSTLASLGCMPLGDSDDHVSFVLDSRLLNKMPGLGQRSLRHHVQTFASVTAENLSSMVDHLGQAALIITRHLDVGRLDKRVTPEAWALIVRRMTLCLGSLIVSAMTNLASALPRLSPSAVGKVCLAFIGLGRVSPVNVNGWASRTGESAEGLGQMAPILQSVKTATGAMASANKLQDLLPPLRVLASEHGIGLLQVGKGGDQCIEFDYFPAKGALGDLARSKLKSTINSLVQASVKNGYPLPSRRSVAAHNSSVQEVRVVDGTLVRQEGNDEELGEERLAEAKAAAGLVIWQAWRRYKRRHALQRLRSSIILRCGVSRKVAGYREMKEAERQQEAARAVQQQHQQWSQGAGQVEDWAQIEEVVRRNSQIISARYIATKRQLVTQQLGGCIVCPHGTAQQVAQLVPGLNVGASQHLQASAPSFVPHPFTLEHTAAENLFLQHCAWFDQHAAPWLGEASMVSAALHNVATHTSDESIRETAKYCIFTVGTYAECVWGMLNQIDDLRDWGYAYEYRNNGLIQLMNACHYGRGFLHQINQRVGFVAQAGVGNVQNYNGTVVGVGAVGVSGAEMDADANGDRQINALLDLGSDDDEFHDAVEVLDDGFKEVKKRKKSKGKNGKRGGGGGKR